MFTDRKDAAMKLAEALKKYKNRHAVVLGIPRGGAETAFYVARYLNADLSLLITKKLHHPNNPAYVLGVMAEDGSIYLNKSETAGLTRPTIDHVVETQTAEIKRRIQIFRKGNRLPSLKNKTAILVDDGIATGATFFAAMKMCKKQLPRKIVVAAPVSCTSTSASFLQYADEVVILDTAAQYSAVSQAYRSFRRLTDRDVLSFFVHWRKEKTFGKTILAQVKSL